MTIFLRLSSPAAATFLANLLREGVHFEAEEIPTGTLEVRISAALST
jgi:hypothetical protein